MGGHGSLITTPLALRIFNGVLPWTSEEEVDKEEDVAGSFPVSNLRLVFTLAISRREGLKQLTCLFDEKPTKGATVPTEDKSTKAGGKQKQEQDKVKANS